MTDRKVSRRGFCHWLAWLFPAGVVATAALIKESPSTFNNEKTHGYIHASDGGAFYKAYLNGEDISFQAFEADDREGFVGLYDADANGNITWPLCRRRVYGKVKIVPLK